MSRVIHYLIALTCTCALTGCAITPATTPASLLSSEADFERYVVVTLRNQAAPAVPRAGSTVRGYDAPSAYALAPATRLGARAIAAAHGLHEVSAWPIGLLGVHCIVFELPRGTDRDEMLRQLRRDRRVEAAQPFNSFSTLSTTANDPYRRLQRNLDLMDVAGAHTWSRGEGVRVAIIDTGVDARHPDLAGRIEKQEDFVGGDARRAAGERHGTAVAGVIAAVENNRQGITGVAPAARLYALRACWSASGDGTGDDAGEGARNYDHALCSTLSLAKAIAAAIEARADVVNLSLTGPRDALLTRLVKAGQQRGIVFVGASPAAGPQTGPRASTGNGFPTGIEGVIGVGVSGSPVPADSASADSASADSASADSASADAVLFAPGREVLTLVPDGRYDFLSGSSLAAASVSGGIALLLARDRDLRAADARDILARSSRPVHTERGTLASVNLCAALALQAHRTACSDRAE